MTDRIRPAILRAIIALFALADGTIHLLLDFVLFRGNFFGNGFRSGPPPASVPPRTGPPPGGGGSPFILPLNELFLLNFVGAVVLVLLFWFSRRMLGGRRWLVDLVLIVYASAAFVAWWIVGRPNPMGLGYLSKSVEIILVISLVADIWSIARPRRIVAPAQA
jgi:hypothetical protein